MILSLRAFLTTLALFSFSPLAFADTKSQIVSNYAQHVSYSYETSLETLQKLDLALRSFVQAPSESTLTAAKTAWIAARTAYSPTEVFRFYGGPIDSETGPEGLLNAWPLDEVYIDYVLGDPDSGIINDLMLYPTISKELLRELNEKDGEKNISTGFHAIEFLLWGQDLNQNGPGRRKFSDYISGQSKNADRRAQYLLVVSEMLIEDMQSLVAAWDIKNSSSYAAYFTAPENTKESLRNILLAAYTLAAEELSQERMFVAYDTQQQEDEHSCFSDTTHMDIYYNYKGIQNVLGLFATDLNLKNSNLQKTVMAQLSTLELQTLHFPAPFDQAILDAHQRPKILEIIHNLEFLGDEILKIAAVYDVKITE